MSVRQQIVDAMTTALQTITIANGYNTDVGQNVHVWLDGQPLTFPALNLRDTVAVVNRGEGVEPGRREHTLTVEIDVKASGAANQPQVRSVIEDVVACFWTHRNWSSLARGSELLESTLILNAGNAEGLVTAQVAYRTDAGQI